MAGISGEYEHGLLRVTLPKGAKVSEAKADSLSLLSHPVDGRPQHRRMFYSIPSEDDGVEAGDEETGGEGINERVEATASAAKPRTPYSRTPVVSGDPRTLGMFGFRPATAPFQFSNPYFGMDEKEGAQARSEADSAAAPETQPLSKGASVVSFLDPSTGASFDVPLEALQRMLAQRMQERAQQRMAAGLSTAPSGEGATAAAGLGGEHAKARPRTFISPRGNFHQRLW